LRYEAYLKPGAKMTSKKNIRRNKYLNAVGKLIQFLHSLSKAGDILSSRHVSSRDVTSAVGIFNIEF
jgi:hypothetical protein